MNREQSVKYCSNVDCDRQGQPLPLNEFYQYSNERYYAECKRCHLQQVRSNQEMGAVKAIEKLLELEIIRNNEVSSARTLFLSCQSRIKDCKYDKGLYKDVECNWESPIAFMMDIIEKLPVVWREWKKQNVIYEETENDADRPTIDRIDEFGDYSLTNIQMLSKHDNSKKASAKPSIAIIFREVAPKRSEMCGAFIFSSKKDLLSDLVNANIITHATQIKFDVGEIQDVGNGYSVLLQTVNGEVPTADEPLYEVTWNVRGNLIDEATGVNRRLNIMYRRDVGTIRI